MRRKTRTEKGITLIALIITIVVLLILAVVSINAIQDTDIIGQTENTANTYNESVANEKNELGNYSSILGQYSEKYPSKPYEEYKVGDEVTIGTESFYVIKDSSKTESKVLLLAKDSINTATLKQENANNVEFATESYWGDGNGEVFDIKEEIFPIPESHTAAKAAYDYGTKVGGTGRLMTYAEADALSKNTDFSSKLYEEDFWIGSATGSSVVYIVAYNMVDTQLGFDIVLHCVRPVVEISKSKVTAVTE